MPRFEQDVYLNIARDVGVFARVEAGVTRGGPPAPRNGTRDDGQALEQARRQLEQKERELEALRAELSNGPALRGAEGVDPSRMVWIFGSGRSGSTWLRSMMAELPGHRVWEEPMVGKLFGDFYSNAQSGQLKTRNFIMGEPNRAGWIGSIRGFVLEGARRASPGLGDGEYLVVKEPNGSTGAPLLMEALPEARMIFLVRDPRDVVASVMDAAREGSWLYQRKSRGIWKENAMADKEPDRLVGVRARNYLKQVGGARQAYESHSGPKALVRYEELRADAMGEMRRLYERLGIAVDEGELRRAAEKYAWESIPEGEKGEGKFYRKATPGSWREDLTPKQVATIEAVTAPLLEEFYPAP